MVITEYLSKYPVAMPITSKSATEMASRLSEYIALFGPPKELLSDQGKEFLNSIVAHISLERKVTAAYNPRTNRLTERFNGTLVNSLNGMVTTYIICIENKSSFKYSANTACASNFIMQLAYGSV